MNKKYFNSYTIRFNREQLKMMIDSIENEIKIIDHIKESNENKRAFNIYVFELKKIQAKFLNAISKI